MEKGSFLTILGGIALVIVLIFVSSNNSFKNNHTAETTATITSTGTGCGSGKTVVRFKYTVNDTLLENWTCYDQLQIMKAEFKVNSPATACYDPSNPKDSSVVPIGYRCGG